MLKMCLQINFIFIDQLLDVRHCVEYLSYEEKKRKNIRTDLLNKLTIHNKKQKSTCLLYVEKYFGKANEGEREKDHILMEWWWKSWWKMPQLTWQDFHCHFLFQSKLNFKQAANDLCKDHSRSRSVMKRSCKIILVFCAGCLYPCLINITTGWHLLSIYCGKNGFKMGADFNLSALNLYVPIFWYLHFVASWSDRNGYWDIKELVLPSWNKSQQIIVVFLYAFVSAYFNLKLEKAYSLGN